MGWLFGGNKTQETQQFGAPNLAAQQNGYGMQQGYGGGYGMQQGGMGGLGMMQQAQNPMMQQAANDPIVATAQLLALYDPMAQFMMSQNMAMVMDLVGEVMMLSIKEFFKSVSFITDSDGKITLDGNSLPSNLATLSPENLALTLQKVQSSAQQTLNNNQQQQQMFLQAHQQGSLQQQLMNPQQQPGFFGNLIGGMMGNAVQQQGGFGATVGQGVGMAAKGAVIL
jgi:hypothetical protein